MDDARAMLPAILSAPTAQLKHVADSGPIALHWYDLTCPFCYVGQARTRLLQRRGVSVIELPFQAHPEIPQDGIHLGPRQGPMYVQLEQAAATIGLPLTWPPRLPNSRTALAAAEWVRRHQHDAFATVRARLFRAHFADGLDIGNTETVIKCAAEAMDSTMDSAMDSIADLRRSLAGGEPFDWVRDAEHLGRQFGVAGTPSWRIAGRMINGFLPESEFEHAAMLAHSGAPVP
jgi:predicted DsbA family dithiol-disulfide isomerase